MLFDAALPPLPLPAIPAAARRAQDLGFAALWTSETQHDPFLPGALIAEHTAQLHFGTAVAIAFARSPATLAYTAWDLAAASDGRFILGLGTQVKAHIERRFGMPWPASPVNKLREQVAAIRACWNSWQTGAPLRLNGEYYRLSLMSPFFNPGPIAEPRIPIFLAGVNAGMARLAGEVSDGFQVHPFHTPAYLQEVLLPAIESGAVKGERARAAVQVAVNAFVATTPAETDFLRQQIAFYASTPSYRAVMTHHGWEEAAVQLSQLAARSAWGDMPALISDQMVETFAVVAAAPDLPAALLRRYAGLGDRLALYLPFVPGERDDFWRGLRAGLAGGDGRD